MTDISGYSIQNRSSKAQVAGREKLYELFRNRPMPDDQALVNLAMFIRSGALAKLFFLNEIYEKIVHIPGNIVEFGTWWGQSLVVFENLRAIHEPYNYTRRVIGFDTFEGYPSVSDNDVSSDTIKVGGYTTSKGYEEYLDELIAYHEAENVMGHMRKHMLVKGDAAKTVPAFFHDNPSTIVALAFFDMALYEPTKACIEAISKHLVKGSVLAFDELNCPEYPGETLAVMEVLGLRNYQIHRSRFLPDRSYVIIE